MPHLATELQAQLDAGGPISIWVINSGGPAPGPAPLASPQEFIHAFAQHLPGSQLMLQLLLPGMRELGYGRIINVLSTSVKAPLPNLGVSNSIRAAMANWAKTLARELAADGITVNNVLPGLTRTARLESLFTYRAQATGKTEEEVAREMLLDVPARRFAEPQEFANAVAFLLPRRRHISTVSICRWTAGLPPVSDPTRGSQSLWLPWLCSVVQFFASGQGIFQQTGPGHGADTTGNRGDPGCPFGGGFKIHIATQAAIFHAVDTHVDDDGAGLDPLTLDQTGLADGNHDQIGAAYMLFQIMGEAVRHRSGAAGQQQLQRHRATDDIGGADYRGIQAVGADTGAFQQTYDAQWGARAQQRYALGQAAYVVGVEAVHILVRADTLQQLR